MNQKENIDISETVIDFLRKTDTFKCRNSRKYSWTVNYTVYDQLLSLWEEQAAKPLFHDSPLSLSVSLIPADTPQSILPSPRPSVSRTRLQCCCCWGSAARLSAGPAGVWWGQRSRSDPPESPVWFCPTSAGWWCPLWPEQTQQSNANFIRYQWLQT